jgi:hypothetical protein
MTKRRAAPEIIAVHFSCDIRDVTDGRYQSTRYASPAIYTFGTDYYAAPANNKPPQNMPGDWREIGEHYGRKVFCLTMAKVAT